MGRAYNSEHVALIGACYDAAVDDALSAGIPISQAMIARIANRLMQASDAGETEPERLKAWALNAIDESRFPAPADPYSSPSAAGKSAPTQT
jgi:hypothetical protein